MRTLEEEIEQRGISEEREDRMVDRYRGDSENDDDESDGLALLEKFFRGPTGRKKANVFRKFISILSESDDLSMDELRERDDDRQSDRDYDDRDSDRYDDDDRLFNDRFDRRRNVRDRVNNDFDFEDRHSRRNGRNHYSQTSE